MLTGIQARTAAFTDLLLTNQWTPSPLAKFVPWAEALDSLFSPYDFTTEWEHVINTALQSQRQSLRKLDVFKALNPNNAEKGIPKVSQLTRLEKYHCCSRHISYTEEEMCNLVFAAPALSHFIWELRVPVYNHQGDLEDDNHTGLFTETQVQWLQKTLELAHNRGYAISTVEIIVPSLGNIDNDNNDDLKDSTDWHSAYPWDLMMELTALMKSKHITLQFHNRVTMR